MPTRRDNDDERLARIDMILEEYRLNVEELEALAERATERARKMREDNRLAIERVRARMAAVTTPEPQRPAESTGTLAKKSSPNRT